MLNLNKTNRNMIAAIAILLALIFAMGAFKSRYQEVTLAEPGPEGSILDLPKKSECTAGTRNEGESTYSVPTPGGICGAEEFVRKSAGYKLI